MSNRRAEQGSLAPFVGVALAALTIGSLVLFSVIAQKASREGIASPAVTAEAPSQKASRSITLAPAPSEGGDNTSGSQVSPDNATQSIVSTDTTSAASGQGAISSSDAGGPLDGSSTGAGDGLQLLLDRSAADALESFDASEAELLALAEEAGLLDATEAELLALAEEAELLDASGAELLALAEDAELLDATEAELLALAEDAELLDSDGEVELSASASRPGDALRPFTSKSSPSDDVRERDRDSDNGKRAKGPNRADRSKKKKKKKATASTNRKRPKHANRSNHRNARRGGGSHRRARASNSGPGNRAARRPAATKRARPAAKPARPASKPARRARSAQASPRRASSKARSQPKRQSPSKARHGRHRKP